MLGMAHVAAAADCDGVRATAASSTQAHTDCPQTHVGASSEPPNHVWSEVGRWGASESSGRRLGSKDVLLLPSIAVAIGTAAMF